MTAINFPSSPVNGDTLTSGNTTYTYNAAKTRWDAVTTVNGIQLNSLSVGAEAPASGDGSIAYNNTSGVFTYTPPVIADPLPAQTGNTGKYLTTDGSTTSWAEVASGASYEIGDGLELQGVTSSDWSAIPAPTASIIGTASADKFGQSIAASTSYLAVVPRAASSTFSVYNAQTGSFERTITKPASTSSNGQVRVSGTRIIFGDSGRPGGGGAYIFEATTGAFIHNLNQNAGNNLIGHAVALSPSYAAVTSYNSDVSASYVNVYNAVTGSSLYTLNNPDTIALGGLDNFGQTLAMNDTYLVVGAFAEEAQDGTSNNGIVYVYSTPTGDLLHTLTCPSPAVFSRYFGQSIAVDGDYIAVADSYNIVYIYRASTGASIRQFVDPVTVSSGFGASATFGQGVSIDGNYLFVGARNTHDPYQNGGRAYTFNITDGSLIHTILPTSAYEELGSAITTAPGVLAIASEYFNNGGASTSNFGKVTLYNTTTSTINYLKPDNTIATTSYVDTAITNLVDSSPAALNTLNELAAALGDDANFSTTVTNSIASKADDAATTSALATKAPLASPTFTGVPVAPTATAGTNTTQIATTAFVTAATANAGGSSDELEFTANGAVTAGKLVVLDAAGTVSQVTASEAGLPQIPYTDSDTSLLGKDHVLLWDDYNEEVIALLGGNVKRFSIDMNGLTASRLSSATLFSSWSLNYTLDAVMIPNTNYFLVRGGPNIHLCRNIGGTVSASAGINLSSVATLASWSDALSPTCLHIFPNGEAYFIGQKKDTNLATAWKINYDTTANTISLGEGQDSSIDIAAISNTWADVVTDKSNNTFFIYYKNANLYISPISANEGTLTWGSEKALSVASSPQYLPWYESGNRAHKVKYSAHTDRFYLPFSYYKTHVGCWVFSLAADGTGILKGSPTMSGISGLEEFRGVEIGVSQTSENVALIVLSKQYSNVQWGHHFGLINADGVYTSSEVYSGPGSYSAGTNGSVPGLTSVDIDSGVVFGIKKSNIYENLVLHVARMSTTTNAQNWIGIASDTVSDGSAVNVHLSTGLSNEHTGLSVGSKYYAAADGGLTTTPSLGYGLVGEALSSTTLQIVSESDLSGYATLLNATLLGTPTAPTATAGNASTQIATTAFVAAATAAAVAAAGGGAGGTFDFLASGAVSAGGVVVLNSGGTVSAVTTTLGNMSPTGIDVGAAGNEKAGNIIYDDFNDEVVYFSDYNAHRISNTSTPAVLSSTNNAAWDFQLGHLDTVVIPGTGHYIQRNYNEIRLLKNDGVSISVVAAAENLYFLTVARKAFIHFPNNDVYVITQEFGSPKIAKVEYDIANGTISILAPHELDWTNSRNIIGDYNFEGTVIRDKYDNLFHISYRFDTQKLYSNLITVDNNIVSFGTQYQYDLSTLGANIMVDSWSGAGAKEWIQYSDSTENLMLGYSIDDGLGIGILTLAISSTGVLTLKSNTPLTTIPRTNSQYVTGVLASDTSAGISLTYKEYNGSSGYLWRSYTGEIDSSGNWTFATYNVDSTVVNNFEIFPVLIPGTERGFAVRQIANSFNTPSKIHTISLQTSSDAGNWIGISSADATNNQSVSVYIGGGISPDQSGLSVGSTYYVSLDGSLTSSPTVYGAIGTALSASSLIVDDKADEIIETYVTRAALNTTLATYASSALVSTKAPLASPTFTGVTTLTATSEVLQPKFSVFAGNATHDMAKGSVFYHDLMMGNFYPEFINVPTTVDLVTSAVLVMAEGEMWGPGTHARVNGTEYAVKWLGGTAPTMSEDVVDVVSYSLINRNGTWVVIGSHSVYSAAV